MAIKSATRIHPLPSSILHNGGDVRSQYTRAASRKVAQAVARKLRFWNRSAVAATTDLSQAQGGH